MHNLLYATILLAAAGSVDRTLAEQPPLVPFIASLTKKQSLFARVLLMALEAVSAKVLSKRFLANKRLSQATSTHVDTTSSPSTTFTKA